ncbi:MAG TPA: hypothetical protein VGB83_10365 [Actinomycetota bacterium]
MLAPIVVLSGTASPSAADPVLCVTVYYHAFGGPREDVVDDCWVSSPWEPIVGTGPDDCYEAHPFLEVCEGTSVAIPMP